MPNISNLRMGVAQLTFGGVSLGHTKGGVTFSYNPKYADLTADQYGDTPIDKVLTGEEATVTVRLAEPQVAELNVAIPAGGDTVGTAAERVGFGTDAGYGVRQDAKQLVLHPAYKSATDLTEDVTLYKAVCASPVALDYQVDKQLVYEVVFTALVDETNGNYRRLGHVGATNVS